MSFVIVVGNPKPASRTLAVATAAAGAILRAAGLTGLPQTIDICVLARHLLLPEPSPAVEEALGALFPAVESMNCGLNGHSSTNRLLSMPITRES